MITPEWGSLKTVVLVRVTITIGLGSDPRASGVLFSSVPLDVTGLA